MTYTEWQQQYPEAAKALQQSLVISYDAPNSAMTEQAVQQECRYLAPMHGMFLGRNNSGAVDPKRPITAPVRFGWCNDSSKLNAVFKTPDLIGWTSVMVTPEMVGTKVAVFTGIEVKDPNWSLKLGDKHAQAQGACLAKILDSGGYAAFVTNAKQLAGVINP